MISRRYRTLGFAALVILIVSIILLTSKRDTAKDWIKSGLSRNDGGKDDEVDYTPKITPTTQEPPQPTDTLPTADKINWSKFAYVQYVTDHHYLCNSVMIFESLWSLGSRAKRVLMYPDDMLADPESKVAKTPEQRLLLLARDAYGVTLVPIEVKEKEGSNGAWANSYTKLHAFKQTNYDRVLALDSDSVVLQNMDELFLMPQCTIAMPRAYWLHDEDPPRRMLSTHVMLLTPSQAEYDRIMARVEEAAEDDYDMEVINHLYLDTAAVLPHRPYELLTSEFRKTNHSRYLGSDAAEWDARKVFQEAKFLHFSDDPAPKPWIEMTEKQRQKHQPECPDGKLRCPSQDLWNGFYNEFFRRRQEVCNGVE
jgi:hypothetical protein